LKTLVLDNGSPFTLNIIKLIDKLNQKYDCKAYNEVADHLLYDKIILSGRQKNNKDINAVNSSIVKSCYNQNIPLLGICYGAEIISLTFGGSIHRIERIQGLEQIRVFEENVLIPNIGNIRVYESHSYSIARLPREFKSVANSKFSSHELFFHTRKKIYGTQFHPENSGKIGLGIFQNFLNITNE
jgi:GMP synthase (glutamine-hydrolysing)